MIVKTLTVLISFITLESPHNQHAVVILAKVPHQYHAFLSKTKAENAKPDKMTLRSADLP